jgi:ankyrin repeat protein
MSFWKRKTEYPKAATGEGEKTRPLSIHVAAEDGDLGEVSTLLGDNPSLAFSRNYNGQTPLYLAARGGGNVADSHASRPQRKAIAELLLANGADVNARNDCQRDTPLHGAVDHGDVEMVKLMLAHGADVDAKDRDDITPLRKITITVSSYHGYIEVAALLLARGANVNARDTLWGCTPLHGVLHQGMAHSNTELAKLLVSHGANVNARDNHGMTPLHYARESDVYELLLTNGADVNAKDNDGRTPLHFAKYGFGASWVLEKHGGHE